MIFDTDRRRAANIYRAFFFFLFVLGLVSAEAHHGSALYYDLENVVKIEGEVLTISWRNPHVMMSLRRTDDGAVNEVWEVESSSANTLLRVGIEQDIVAVGDHVILTGALSRHGLPAMAAFVITLENGTEFPIWPRPAMRLGYEVKPAPISAAAAEISRSEAQGIFRVWSRSDLKGLFLQSDHLPFTPAALAAQEAWNPLEDDPVLDCIPRGMPSVMNTPFPVEFIDQQDVIIMRLEEWNVIRTIHLESVPSANARSRTPLGYSVGHWEGKTLVVTTTAISDEFFDDGGMPQGESAEIVERFTLNDNEQRLDYESIHTDPFTFSEPARQTGYWDWIPGEQIRSFDCEVR